ncbi:hypothetical protein FACS1894216_03090 [Synergistales bacterium]|nr:hypothetical protein FACS1894216_03090 [Synergistales bacterium]
MIASILIWLLQDCLQVAAMGIMLVPELFLLVVIYKTLTWRTDQKNVVFWIWFALTGGVLWDLRWTTFAGLSGLINVSAVAAAYWIWQRTPIAGRNPLLFALLAGGAHFLSGIAHYFAWSVPSQAALMLFAIQQLVTVPFLVLLCVIYSLKAPKLDA